MGNDAGAAAPQTAQDHLREHGWAVVPDVLTRARAGEVLERLWAAAEESERRGVATFMPVLDPNAANVRVFGLLDIDPVFRDLIRHPVAISLVRALVGEPFLISNFTANIARPGSKSMSPHSDLSLVAPAPWAHPWSMNIIWCLTDVTFENGATLYLPGSHRFTGPGEVPAEPIPLMKPFEARAGSILAMDGRLWHTSGANITADQDRAMMFGYYSAAFLRPQVNWNAALSADTQAGLDAEMRGWLGLEADANVTLAGVTLGPTPGLRPVGAGAGA